MGSADRGGYVVTEGGNRRRAWKPSRSVARRMYRLICERDDYTCQICGHRVDPATVADNYQWNGMPGILSLDHVIPYCAGGPFTEQNLQTLCLPCNLKKGARLP